MENNQQNGRTDSATLMCILTVTFQINVKNLVYWITIYCLQETHLKKKKNRLKTKGWKGVQVHLRDTASSVPDDHGKESITIKPATEMFWFSNT